MKINKFKKTSLFALVLLGVTLLGNNAFAKTPNVMFEDGGQSVDILENLEIGTSIGSLLTPKDDISPNPPYTYTLDCSVLLSAGVDDAFFQINGDQLEVATVFDYENPVDDGVNNDYNICIKSTNDIGEIFEDNFYITVRDATDTPTNLQIDGLDSASQLEGTPLNTVIGSFEVTEEDIGEGQGTYEFGFYCETPGDDDSYFEINGSDIENIEVFDYVNPVDANGDNEYEVCVAARTVESDYILSYEKNFIIGVTALPVESSSTSSHRKSSRRLTQDQVNEIFGARQQSSSTNGIQQLQLKLISLITQLLAIMQG